MTSKSTIIYFFVFVLILLAELSSGANLEKEFPAIEKAAIRNNCLGDDFILLLAIRLSENGAKGLEFGVMNPRANNLDKQAGWAAATIMKHHKRFGSDNVTFEFVHNLQHRYCPDYDGGKEWLKNVWFWFGRLKNES